MKHFLLISVAISYFIFQIISLNSINNNGIIQSKSVLEVFISESKIDKINSISENSFLKDYYNKLYTEADFQDEKELSFSKEGFKKPYLFFLFLKDVLVKFFNVFLFIFLVVIAFKLIKSIYREKKERRVRRI